MLANFSSIERGVSPGARTRRRARKLTWQASRPEKPQNVGFQSDVQLMENRSGKTQIILEILEGCFDLVS